MNWLQHLLLTNIYIALLLGFYVLLLRKETFFQLNRVFLLCSLIISAVLPSIQTGWLQQLNIMQQLHTVYLRPVTIFADQRASSDHVTLTQAIWFIYLAGLITFSADLIIRLIGLKIIVSNPGESDSWSFFKRIHLGKAAHTLIGEHEKIHASQWHSADILLMEVVVTLNWFNPAVYIFRKELKSVHEFIADEGTLRSATNKKEYVLLLISQTFDTSINNLVNPFFNQNLLKQRIMMIQKNKSNRGRC